MRTELACLPCFSRQVDRTLSFSGADESQRLRIRRHAMSVIEDASFDLAPARISTLLHRLIRDTTGTDPYKCIKSEYNKIALGKLETVRALARAHISSAAGDFSLLEGGVRAAIAGNIIDFGIYDSVDLDRSLDESFCTPLATAAFASFSRSLSSAKRILYLCDNAGEIVFDRILMEFMRSQGKDVIAVVKGRPVINDATIEDADETGLAESATLVIDNGNDGIGTLLELCSRSFMDAYRSADLIISKGQANYETLSSELDDRIYYLFKVKCPVVATTLGRNEGDIVLMDNRSSRPGDAC